MPLIVPIYITGQHELLEIDRIVISRLEPLLNPDNPWDEVHTYQVEVPGETHVRVRHRYGDGGRELLRLALNTLPPRPPRN
jgi:hypothetical protein